MALPRGAAAQARRGEARSTDRSEPSTGQPVLAPPTTNDHMHVSWLMGRGGVTSGVAPYEACESGRSSPTGEHS